MPLSEVSNTKPLDRSGRNRTWVEISIVFALSLGASAFYSLVSLISKLTAVDGLAAQTTKLNPSLANAEWLDFTYRLLGITFGLAPVALVLFLLWAPGRSAFELLGIGFRSVKRDTLGAIALASAIGVPGIALYFIAREFGLSSQVQPAELGGAWWVVPILLLAAVKAALLEEVIVVGYLTKRLEALGLSSRKILLISAGVRGSYHLYQGFAGLIGNFVMGLVFTRYFQKRRRLMPLIIAHFLMDAFVFVGYALLQPLLPPL